MQQDQIFHKSTIVFSNVEDPEIEIKFHLDDRD